MRQHPPTIVSAERTVHGSSIGDLGGATPRLQIAARTEGPVGLRTAPETGIVGTALIEHHGRTDLLYATTERTVAKNPTDASRTGTGPMHAWVTAECWIVVGETGLAAMTVGAPDPCAIHSREGIAWAESVRATV